MPKLVQCPNGHFYDAERSEQCPYCDRPGIPMPPDCPGREEFMRRLAEREAAERERGVTAEIPPVDGPAADKTVPLQEEGADKIQPLTDAGIPSRQSNWQLGLLRIALGIAVFGGLLAAFRSFQYRAYGRAWDIGFLWDHVLGRGLLVDVICCVVTCLCCIWFLRTKGARPGFPLSTVSAAANIGLALYGCNYFFRLISRFGLSKAVVILCEALIEAVTMLLCLIAAILAWAAISLYQYKQRRNSK